jgi:hypothetical protein
MPVANLAPAVSEVALHQRPCPGYAGRSDVGGARGAITVRGPITVRTPRLAITARMAFTAMDTAMGRRGTGMAARELQGLSRQASRGPRARARCAQPRPAPSALTAGRGA